MKEQLPKAIVVDNSKSFLMYMSILLNRMNLDVLPVANAEEALELARVTRPHLMTLDMVMSGKDGLETLRAIREDAELGDLPVIMISSYRDNLKLSEAMSLGCTDILDKPVDLRRLHRALQNCNVHAGGRRRYLRAPFIETVELQQEDLTTSLVSVTLSERGIYIRTSDAMRPGMPVRVRIPMPDGELLQVRGKVIYNKSHNGGRSVIPPGVAIKFDHMTTRDMELLGELVTELLIGDIIAEQQEMFVQPH